MLENQLNDIVEETSQSKVVSSVIIEKSVNAMHSPDKVHKIEHEPCQDNIYVEGKIVDVDEGETIIECNDTLIVFRNLKLSQKNATIKSRQKRCNAIKFKKSNTIFQTNKFLFKVKKVSIINIIRDMGK